MGVTKFKKPVFQNILKPKTKTKNQNIFFYNVVF